MIVRHAILWTVAISACASPSRRTVEPPNAADVSIAEVRRSSPYRNADREKLGLGTISVAVRSVDEPTGKLGEAFVELRSATDSLVSRRPVSKSGIVAFDSVRAGNYAVAATRIGYFRMRIPAVVVEAGCRVEIEAYLRIDVWHDILPPPPPQTPGRATITYCRTP